MNQDYSTSFMVDKTPDEVFKAINNVRSWWSGEFEGETDKLNSEFTYRYQNFHRSTQKITELIPGKKIVWHVLDAQLNFVKDKNEWNGTDIIFEITKKGDQTEVRFTHKGLLPSDECYDTCSNAWSSLMHENLRNLISTGDSQPDVIGDPKN